MFIVLLHCEKYFYHIVPSGVRLIDYHNPSEMSYNIAMTNNRAEGDDRRLTQGQVFAVMLLIAFTIVMSWRLMAGNIAPAQGFLWMGVCCFVPIAWYIFGFFKSQERRESNALMTSAIGWILVALGFLVHYNALLDMAPGTPAGEVSDPLITIFLLLGLFILVVGGFLSWQAATNSPFVDTLESQ